MAVGDAVVSIQETIPEYPDKESISPKASYHGQRSIRQRPVLVDRDTGFENERLSPLGVRWQRMRENVLVRYVIYIVPVAILLAIPIILFSTVYKGRMIISTFETKKTTPIYTANITEVGSSTSSNITSIYNNTTELITQEKVEKTKGGIHILGLFIWIEVVWVLLWIAKLLAQAVPIIFQNVGGAIQTGIRKYWLILKAVEIPISLFFWAILAIASFPIIYTFDQPFHKEHAGKIKWLSILHNVIKATIGITALYLVEKMLIQLVSVNYHGKQFYDHIKELKTVSRALETMLDVSRHRFPDHHPSFKDDDMDIHDTRGLRQEKYGETRALILTNLGKGADKITTVFGYMVSDIAGKQVLQPTASGPLVEAALLRPSSAEALARRIWNSFTNFGENRLDEEAIIAMMGEGREDQALYIMDKLDADENGDVTLEEMVELVVRMASDRKTIWEGANDVKDAIKVLDRVLSVIVLIFIILIYAAFFSDYLANHYTQVWSTFVGLSFLFASTATELFAACITVFIKHPYDVGDRIVVNDTEMDVVKISLLYSVFREVMSKQVLQIPNGVINGLWIKNLTRSKELRESISLQVSAGTSFQDLETMRLEMLGFVAEHKRDYLPEVDLQLVSIKDLAKLELHIEFQHKGNHASDRLRSQRRSKFVCALLSAVRKVPIDPPGGSSPARGSIEAPTYTVTISDDVAKSAMAQHNEEADAKRMNPKNAATAGRSAADPIALSGRLGSTSLEILPSLLRRTTGSVSHGIPGFPSRR